MEAHINATLSTLEGPPRPSIHSKPRPSPQPQGDISGSNKKTLSA